MGAGAEQKRMKCCMQRGVLPIEVGNLNKTSIDEVLVLL
jgi:hypothetical protein